MVAILEFLLLTSRFLGYRQFGKIVLVFYYNALFALMMKVVNTSETSVNFYQTMRSYNPEDSHLLHYLDRSALSRYPVTRFSVSFAQSQTLPTCTQTVVSKDVLRVR
jgi:hypothetical protein